MMEFRQVPFPQAPVAPGGAAAPAEPVLFDAVLYPQRSLSPRGFWILMGIVAGLSFSAGIVFMLMGAWPVLGFFGADVLLLGLFFHLSFRRARLYETVRLTPDRLTVRRVHPDGQARTWTFQPFWLRVEIRQPHRHGSELSLISHGRRLTIGSFLNAGEKADFADALRRALEISRRPPLVAEA